jgi:hypothetical protein
MVRSGERWKYLVFGVLAIALVLGCAARLAGDTRLPQPSTEVRGH